MVNLSKIGSGLIYTTDIVDYQENAVVSKTIIDKNVGSVTFFAFADEQGLSEHSAPYDALVYITEGEAEIIISGKPNRLKKDEFIIMPGNKPHSLSAITKFKMMLVMIKA
jgi:quercetin dioxygenase-like cupin family protein